MTNKKKSVYIIYTGGTIGMEKTPGGYVPKANYLAGQMAKSSALAHEDIPAYTLNEYQPLLDSSNMTPQHWTQIANDIKAHYDQFDGFIILHGTDTMAYTASALSFMLENLGKPVILTGSQVPLAEAHTDARENLITAMLLAQHPFLPEVCIYFNRRLFRGNRARKMDAHSFAAFTSPNYPVLADVGIHIDLHTQCLLPIPTQALTVQTVTSKMIVYQRLFPGFNADILKKIIELPLQALILETYGIGNAPSDDLLLLATLEAASAKGIIVINSSQCEIAQVDMQSYATGKALQDAGVMGAGDMTPEAIIGKLYYLLSKYPALADVKTQFANDLRGELTPST